MRYALIAGVTLTYGMVSVAVGGDPVIFDNLFSNGGFGLARPDPASQLDTVYPFDAGVADDFVLGASGGQDDQWQVTGVNWWGHFFADEPPDIVDDIDFVITFWPDAGGMPTGGTGIGEAPDYGQALARFWIDGNANQADQNGDGILEYSTDLPGDGFLADPDTTYWLEIQPIFSFPPQWAWQATLGLQGNQAVTGFDLLEIQYWTDAPETVDVAFQVSGRPVIPSPGTAALLAVAAFLTVSHRRRR